MKGKITAIVVDDEERSIETLAGLLSEYCPEVHIHKTFSNPIDAMKVISGLKPDLLFLDIQMPVLNGLDLQRIVGNHSTQTIYVTGHKEFAIQALRLHATDYLLKPVDPEELQNAVNKAIEKLETRISPQAHGASTGNLPAPPNQVTNPSSTPNPSKDYLRVPHQDGFRMLFIPDILRIEADNSYSTIYLKGGLNMIVSKGIKDFDSLLPEQAFVRVHRSHIVNLRYVFAYSVIDGGQVTLSNGDKIPVSRRRLKVLKEKLDQWSTKLG